MILQASSRPKSVSWPVRTLIGACFALCGGAQLALAASAPQVRATTPRPATRVAPAQEPTTARVAWPNEPAPLEPRQQEERLRDLGYHGAHLTVQGHGDGLARAAELVERALARNPEDADLREALALMEQARDERAADSVARRRELARAQEMDKALKDYREANSLYAKRAAEEKDRYALGLQHEDRQRDSELQRQRLLEQQRDYLDRSRAMKGSQGYGREGLEAELQDTLAELDALRARIEDLRARARANEASRAGDSQPK